METARKNTRGRTWEESREQLREVDYEDEKTEVTPRHLLPDRHDPEMDR